MGISQTPQALVPASLSSGAGNMVQIATGTLSGASVTISSLSNYTELFLALQGTTNDTANGTPYVRINGNSGTNYNYYGWRYTTVFARIASSTEAFYLTSDGVDRTSSSNAFTIYLSNCKNAGFTRGEITAGFARGGGGIGSNYFNGVYVVSETVSSIVFANDGGNWSGGTYTLWGA